MRKNINCKTEIVKKKNTESNVRKVTMNDVIMVFKITLFGLERVQGRVLH